MRVSHFESKRPWLGPALAVLLLSSLFTTALAGQTALAVPPSSGIVCTTSTGPNPTFTLTARPGYVSTPDGNVIFMWSFSSGNDPFQLPGPVLCVNQGDNVTVVLNNTLPEDVSIIFPGQLNVMANGTLAQPQADPSDLVSSLTNVAPKNGGTVIYQFTASQPGTYLYESGTDMGKQVNMGLFGGLVVRPAGHPDWANGRPDSVFNPSTEYIMILSEIDPDLHAAVEQNRNYNIASIHPRYWMINGRSFPDTIADNYSPLLPGQPYGALVHMRPYEGNNVSPFYNPNPALVRYINVGMRNHPFHPHGNHGRIIARDGQPMEGPAGQDLSEEKFLVLVGSSQTWDVTYNWTDRELWKPVGSPGATPIPITLPPIQNQMIAGGATWYSGSPYLGVQDELLVGNTSFNQCGEYYHVWHSHALNEAANYDTGFGGMFTLQRIDPPGGCP